MAYAIYTAVVKNCCTSCTVLLLHVVRIVLLCNAVCAYFVLRTVHELYCTQFTHNFLLTRFAFALLNFLGYQHSIVLFKVLLCGGFCFCIRCTTVVLPALEVLSVFCFRCSYKTAVVLFFYTVSFLLNFELVMIYRGLLHCCTLVYTYVQQYLQQYYCRYNSTTSRIFSILTSIVLHFDRYVRFDPTLCRSV